MYDDDIKPRTYQDDFDYENDDSDDFSAEVVDDPARELGIPRRDLKEGLDRTDFHPDANDIEEPDDWRESVEDLDEKDGDSAGWGTNK